MGERWSSCLIASSASSLPRDLGDGLVLRAGRLDDGAELIDFNGAMHADEGLPAIDARGVDA